ncbi:MAG: anthranilate phosphoribosyltransferase [Candidatus Altiarchaeota archaeon]|nr:anthranilate phosphoribosyltransferase [Candidatus Altiarchaeota archaeon]
MKKVIEKLVDGKDLTADEAASAMKTIMSGKSSDAQSASFLTAIRIKGETPQEIAALAKVMHDFAGKIDPRVDGTLVDVCGTGGDLLNTFNISTTSMFIVAAAGIPVAKHGNRSITSKCGSADVLEALGVNLEMEFDKIRECIEETGIGFMYAPLHHSAMKHVMPVRRELGVRTVFNMLGPLTNPANARAQVMGVFNPDLTEKLASVFKILNLEHAIVAYGEPGLDELSTLGKTKISELRGGQIKTYYIRPEDYGLRKAKPGDIQGGTAIENTEILRDVLASKDGGAKTDIALLNASAGIVAGGGADNIGEGLEVAREVLYSGKAYKKLNEFIDFAR